MNKKQLGTLMAVNLRLLNPQVTDRYRKKGKTGASLTRKLWFQFLINGAIFLLIYGMTMISVDFSKLPGMFTFYVAIFILLAISQSISGIYNIFFAGKDLNSYLPLPFRQKEIFLSKILVVSFNVIPFSLPLFVVFILLGWRSGMMIPLAILMSLVVYLLLMAVIFMLCSLIVFALTKTKLFREHQNLVMNILTGVTLAVVLGGIYLINGGNSSSTDGMIDRPVILFLMPIFDLFKQPISLASGFSWLGLLGLTVILVILLKQLVLPKISEQLTSVNTAMLSNSHQRSSSKRHGLNADLDAYNRQLLKEPNLMLQVIMNSIMVPVIFIFSFAFAKVPNGLGLEWLGVFFVGGLAFSTITVNPAALVANLISLDRANLEFVRSLPISMRRYLQRKFLLGYEIQLLVNLLMVVIISIIIKAGLLMSLSLIFGTILGTYFVSLHYFRRDYRLRITNWTNVTELFNRGGGNLGMMATMFATLIIGVILIVGYSMIIIMTPFALIINTIVAILVITVSVLIFKHYQITFWKRFN
ncbi:ABC transporter permease [Companilactobacillus zhachilii]|uniref:ABC transporter permease n=1 Tax=Companilactobacillus zhachilii TaxID=2304606 RepID=UPI0040339400